MGDAARPPHAGPMTGAGEAERDTNVLSTGDTRSLLPSSNGEGVLVPDVDEEVESTSSAPSVFWAADPIV